MRHLWFLTFVCGLYGVAIGVWSVATPQACLALGLTSEQLGIVGAGAAVGYALSCLLLGQLLRAVPGKYVLLGGVALALGAAFAMREAQGAGAAIAAQLTLGVASGAFWPFCSAWMLDFQAEGLSKTRILRHYNLAWTSGTMLGYLAGGWLCESGAVFGSFLVCAGIFGISLLLALAPKATENPGHEVLPTKTRQAAEAARTAARRVGWPLLVAAVLANLVALASRAVVNVNYAELNETLGFGKERMGYLGAASLAGQMLAFACGRFYEPYLGLRRTYALMGLVLAGLCAGYAEATWLPALLLLAALNGLVLAVAFQHGLFAAIGFFAAPRTGTTVHEAAVGLGTLTPALAGLLVQAAKESAWDAHAALRAPLWALALLALAGLGIQLLLVSLRREDRLLLRAA
ncbi:MAG: MFS transporter [Planctomycetota bacterium]|nr:MFS transporter [Planctomycetota bacterium]